MSKSQIDNALHTKILAALENQDTSVIFDEALEHEMILNMGPQHPATHGVLRLLLKLDGETVVSVVPDLGYLHRGYEKIAENSSYHEFIPHTDRLDYLSPLSNNVAYTLAVEKLIGIEVPLRAEYLRVIVSEMARIASHLVALGSMAMDVGAVTILLWTFREREKLQDVFDVLCGARFTTSYSRIGGLVQDMNDSVAASIKEFIKEFPKKLDECVKLLNTNRIFIERTDGIGRITKEDAIAIGLTGPNLRGAGVDHDLRRDNPYFVYDKFEFDVCVQNGGDALARYFVRVNEMYESVRILRQALEKIPAGPVLAREMTKKVLPQKDFIYTKMEALIHDFILINFGINPPVGGEIYQAVEAPKGELGFYLYSDGTGSPWRLKIRSPSFVNIQALPILLKGAMISDVVAIIGSLDPVMGEADK